MRTKLLDICFRGMLMLALCVAGNVAAVAQDEPGEEKVKTPLFEKPGTDKAKAEWEGVFRKIKASERLTKEEEIVKCKFAIFLYDGYYAEKGELKTKYVKKDFEDNNIPLFAYDVLKEDLKTQIYQLRMMGVSEEEITSALKRSLDEFQKTGKKDMLKKIAKLEKKLEEEKIKEAEKRGRK